MAKFRVLVVDDVLIIREHVTELLMDTGLVGSIGLVSDVSTAIKAIQMANPQVVILDIFIPGVIGIRYGIDLLKWIKPNDPAIHVVMLSNLSNRPSQHQCAISFRRGFG